MWLSPGGLTQVTKFISLTNEWDVCLLIYNEKNNHLTPLGWWTNMSLAIVLAEAKSFLKAWKTWIRTENRLPQHLLHPPTGWCPSGRLCFPFQLRDSLSRLQILLVLIFLAPFHILFLSPFSVFTFQSICFGLVFPYMVPGSWPDFNS